MIYLLFITLGLAISYFALFALFTYFFAEVVRLPKDKVFPTIGLIVLLSLGSYLISYSVNDPELGNRLLHALGGGFSAFVVCYLAAKNSQVRLRLGQFIIFSLLIVTALGVGNEVVEFILQEYTTHVAAYNVNDTWLDLVSNTTGALVAVLLLGSAYKKLNLR